MKFLYKGLFWISTLQICNVSIYRGPGACSPHFLDLQRCKQH